MIIIEKIDDRYKTHSDKHVMIRPILDRLGNEINSQALYEEAIDVEVNGKPRFDYEETDIKREIEQEIEEEP